MHKSSPRACRAALLAALLFLCFQPALTGPADQQVALLGPSAEFDFPPPPPAEERVALNDAEREAGVVVLEELIEVAGNVKRNAWTGRFRGATEQRRRVRYLVLDEKGAEALAEHAFFGKATEGVVDVRGRTLAANGEEYPVDPEKDVRDMDVRDALGKTQGVVRTVFFPRVEPGAVLDLFWSVKSKEIPDLEVVALQREVPVRTCEVRTHGSLGHLQGIEVRWVPFFTGLVPPEATVDLQADFSLRLEVRSIPALRDEPYSPPIYRTAYALALMPKGTGTPSTDFPAWRRRLGSMEKTGEHELGPDGAMVRIDALGAQELPSWSDDREMLSEMEGVLERARKSFEKFRNRAKGGETPAEVSAIAPTELAPRERVERLWQHAWSRAPIDPDAEERRALRKVLQQGSAVSIDYMLYLDYLLEQAGIPSRIVLAFSRYRIPYQPITEHLGMFRAKFLLEINVGSDHPLYLLPCCLYANAHSFWPAYQGVLAFREPAGESDKWEMYRVPIDIPVTSAVRLEFRSPLPGEDGDEVELHLKATGSRAASHSMRHEFGVKKTGMTSEERKKLIEKREDSIDTWINRWANVRFEGSLPDADPRKDVEKDFVFEVSTPWKPEISRLGGQLLVPAIVRADLFQNVFRAETRDTPLWFNPGRREFSLTWELPAGVTAETVPEPIEATGPGGLHFSMETHVNSTEGAGHDSSMTTRVVIDIPTVVHTSDYAWVQEFFSELQKATESRVLLDYGPGA